MDSYMVDWVVVILWIIVKDKLIKEVVCEKYILLINIVY